MAIEFKSLQADKSKACIALLGPSGHGKTTTALTLSEKFTGKLEPQVLDDIVVVTFEPDAMRAPKTMGIEVPYWLDLTDYTDQGQKVFDDALTDALKKVKEMASSGKIRGVVFDSASTLDKTWKAYLSKQYEKWSLIDAILIKHRNFLVEKVIPLPVPTVLVMHTKTVSKEMDATKKESLGIDADDKQVMDIGGWDAPGLYRALCSFIIPVKKTEGKGGKADEVALYPNGISGIESKCRHFPKLPDRMPANLQELFKAIKL